MNVSTGIEWQCSHCKKFFPDTADGMTPRHTALRGFDVFVCRGSNKAPRASRVVYQ